jgi:hypothetical protein
MRRVFRQRSEAFDLGLVFVTSGGLRQRRSRRVIGDEIKARLRGYFENERQIGRAGGPQEEGPRRPLWARNMSRSAMAVPPQ